MLDPKECILITLDEVETILKVVGWDHTKKLTRQNFKEAEKHDALRLLSSLRDRIKERYDEG